ncbi:MAG: FtsW/RodA/SpoVE family cell cycle protein [Verrucomicrobiales bacterium]
MSPLLRKIISQNWYLTGALAIMIIFGINAVAVAGENNPNPSILNAYKSQINFALAGALAYFLCSLIDYKWLRWVAAPGMLVGLGLLVFALLKGEEINDTKGWVRLAGVQFQPSQFAMGAAIIAASFGLGGLRKFHWFFRLPFVNLALIGFLMGVPCLLVLLQGDVGSALVWLPVSAAVCLVGNIPFRHLALVFLAAMIVLPPFYFFGLNESRRSRIVVYLDMLQGRPVDIRGEGYAAHYASTAVGSGGWNGFGRAQMNSDIVSSSGAIEDDAALAERKNSLHAQGLIPRKTAHTDFIFAVLAERYGFRGSMLLLTGYAALLVICLVIAYGARDLTGRLLVTGVAALLFAHVFQNVGMNVLLTPITGIPLPFISYGGTFLLVVMSLMGLVQSVWIHRIEEEEPKPEPEPDRLRGLFEREQGV